MNDTTIDAALAYNIFERKDLVDGLYMGVRTTGIFCRPACPARLPRFENCEFFPDAEAAVTAGYRACKRCHPMGQAQTPLRRLIDMVEQAEDQPVTEKALRTAGIDPLTARRHFKSALGMSFSEYGRLRRLALAEKALSRGERVITAQLDAGFSSASGFRAAYAKTFGIAPEKARSGQRCAPLQIDWIDTPLGRMVSVSDDQALYLIEFTDRVKLPRQFERLRRQHGRAIVPGTSQTGTRIKTEMAAYFEGARQEFTTPLVTTGTDFQDGVWSALQTIPYGAQWTYADLARRIGNEKAVRAVASANGANGLAIIIPCHRVIGSDGGLGGYAGGIERKRALLDLEARVIR